MIIIAVILLVISGILWLSAQSINRRGQALEDEARFSDMSASGISRDESQADWEEDERLARADAKALSTYARVLKAASIVCMAVAAIIVIATNRGF